MSRFHIIISPILIIIIIIIIMSTFFRCFIYIFLFLHDHVFQYYGHNFIVIKYINFIFNYQPFFSFFSDISFLLGRSNYRGYIHLFQIIIIIIIIIIVVVVILGIILIFKKMK